MFVAAALSSRVLPKEKDYYSTSNVQGLGYQRRLLEKTPALAHEVLPPFQNIIYVSPVPARILYILFFSFNIKNIQICIKTQSAFQAFRDSQHIQRRNYAQKKTNTKHTPFVKPPYFTMDNTPGNDDAAAAPQDVEEGSAARRGRGKPLTNSERDAILHSLLGFGSSQ